MQSLPLDSLETVSLSPAVQRFARALPPGANMWLSCHCGVGFGLQSVFSLSQVDFHGSYSEAHSAGDFGTVYVCQVCFAMVPSPLS